MNKIILLGFAVIGLSAVNQAFSWTFNLANWSGKELWALSRYAVCRDDVHPRNLKPGDTVTFDAKECLLTGIDIKEASTNKPGKSYTSSGQRKYNGFYVIVLNGTPTVFRKSDDNGY